MKPCRKNQKLITWLAAGALEPAQTRELRAHLEVCPGCRSYLDEISTVVQKVSAAAPGNDIQAPASFHDDVLAALRREAKAANTLPGWLRWPNLNWRTAVPVFGTAAALLATLIVLYWPARSPIPASTVSAASQVQTVKRDPQPTIANYQMVANRSLEELDELLSRQASRSLAPAPIQTAGALALVSRSLE